MRLRLAGVRRAIVVAPHPDDEIIGAAGLIAALKRRGAAVQVIVVSDGGASHPGSRRWPARRLIAARRAESVRALRRLTVLPRDVTFLALPDGALPAHQTACRRRLRRAIRQRGAPDLLVAPTVSDAHPDHRAVAAALHGAAGRYRSLGYQIWPPRRHGGGRTRTIVMPGGAAAKRALIRLHRTQLGAITDDPRGFAIARHELAVFAHPIERFTEARR